jgi:hypothetical protein
MIILGIAGPAGAGKDTVADYLVEHHRFVKLAFAGPLKEMLAAAGMPEPADREQKEQLVPGFTFTWRQAAQRLGTEWGRGLQDDIWVQVMRQRIERLQWLRCSEKGRIVLSDVRFDNEAAMIRELGGRVVHLRARGGLAGDAAGHASEVGLKAADTDYNVNNGSSIEYLHAQIEAIIAMQEDKQ